MWSIRRLDWTCIMPKSVSLHESFAENDVLEVSQSRLPASGRPRLYLVREAVRARAFTDRLLLALALGAGAFLRFWDLIGLGLNTDEAVYAGQAAAIVNDLTLKP